MTKINNYIRYLLTLILLGSINVYAQPSGNLNQLISQANRELSNLLPSSTSSINTTSLAEMIKQNINTFGWFFFNYAIPFLFVFGVLTYLAWESRKEINRPLLLIFFIIAGLTTVYLHDVLTIIALVFGFILLIIGIHKIFHGITGSIIALIITIVIIIFILTNNIEFLFSTAFFIFLFVFFIIMVILSIKIHREVTSSEYFKKLTEDLKYLHYKLKTPQDIRGLKEGVDKTIEDLKMAENDIISKIDNLNKLLININQQKLSKNKKNKIERLYNDIKTFFYQCDKVKASIDDWKKHINQYYNGPVKSDMLNFLNRKEQEIDLIKRKVWLAYSSKILPKEQLIRNILGKRKVKGGKRMKKGKKTP
jgi:chaperonin cofactor prefoldin